MTADLSNLSYTPGTDGYVWQPPDDVPAKVKAEASRMIAPFHAALAAAPRMLVAHWLTQLGILVAGNMPVADAKAKVAGYVADLDFPALCFTDATRAAAAREFKWFPSFAELSEFLEKIAKPHRARLYRIKTIAGRPVRPDERRKGWSDLSPAERLAHDELMARVKRELAASEPQPKRLYPPV